MTTEAARNATISFRGHLHAFLLEEHNLDDFLAELTETAADVIADGSRCAVALLPQSFSPVTVSRDDRALAMETTQSTVSRGPTHQAARTRRIVVVDDWRRGGAQWPECGNKARSIGVRGSLAVPLDIGTETVGALSFHYFSARVPHTRTLPILQAVAEHSSAALRIALQHEQLQATMALLEATMATERLVNHAVGIIMGTTRRSPKQASALLYAAAEKSKRRIADVAAEVVHQATGKQPDENLHFFRTPFATPINRTDIGQRA